MDFEHDLMEKAIGKRKSIKRTLGSVISLADVLAEQGLGSVPGGASVYKLTKILVKHAREYFADRRDRRLEEFHKKLLDGIPQESQKEFLTSKFSIEEYYSFLSQLVQDEEDRKVDIYARIFQGLVLTVLPQDVRLHLVGAARELKFSDFDLMRRIYISDRFEFLGSESTSEQIEAITKTEDPIRMSSIENLVRLGFLVGTERPLKPTKLLYSIVELLYQQDELTPESIGKQRKTFASEMSTVLLACDALDDNIHTQASLLLSHALFNEHIRNIIANPIRPFRGYPPTVVIALCVGSKGSPFESVKKFVGIDDKLLIQVLLPGADKEKLPLEGVPIFDFTGGEITAEEVNRFVRTIKEELTNKGWMKSYEE